MDQFDEVKSSREIIKDKLRQYFDGKIVRKDLTKHHLIVLSTWRSSSRVFLLSQMEIVNPDLYPHKEMQSTFVYGSSALHFLSGKSTAA